MRVALLSSTEFGRRCLEEAVLGAADVEVVGILTTPQAIPISYSDEPVRICTHADFTGPARRAGCEVVTLTGKVTSDSYREALARWRPDLMLALGWYYMVPRSVREMAPMGCAGIHASLLPKYRGGAPIPWAIIHGEEEAGVSFFYFADGMDDGDLIGQAAVPIALDDTCATVYEKATEAAVGLLRALLPQMARGTAPRLVQDESRATYVDQRAPQAGHLLWREKSARQAHDWVRAQTRPYPGAFTYLGGEKVTLWATSLSDRPPRPDAAPGAVAFPVPEAADAFGVRCAGGGLVLVHEVETEADGPTSGAAFAEARGLDDRTILGAASLDAAGP